MAYRRRQVVGGKGSTFEEFGSLQIPPSPLSPPPPENADHGGASTPPASSLAAKAIRASSAHRDSSLSSAYGQSAVSSPREGSNSNPLRSSPPSSSSKDFSSYQYTSMKSLNESKQGFWGVLARKAKAIIDDDDGNQDPESPGRTNVHTSGRARSQSNMTYPSPESRSRSDPPKLQKGLHALTSSFNYISGTIGNAFEEGLTVVENRTADIIQETRKLQIKKKGSSPGPQVQTSTSGSGLQQTRIQTHVQPQMQADLEIQLKASRDVAMAMAAKAKLLLRELKSVKADLAFAKERCAQLEEENRILRENRDGGDDSEDDDLIRLQLESLLAEKARLAQENSVFARENRFLREIVEYHQLTMQDVIYLDEGNEEVTEVYPFNVTSSSTLQSPSTLPPPSIPFSPPSPVTPFGATSQ